MSTSSALVPNVQLSHLQLRDQFLGLSSCTESLGFESTEERSSIDGVHFPATTTGVKIRAAADSGRRMMMMVRDREIRERRTSTFPPPLRSLNRLGQPSFVLCPVRRDGRLELREIRTKTPEILCATRDHGRLTLHLLRELDECRDQMISTTTLILGGGEEGGGGGGKKRGRDLDLDLEELKIINKADLEQLPDVDEEEMINHENEEIKHIKLDRIANTGEQGSWMPPVNSVGVDTLRRCYEDLNDAHPHHHLHSLRQHCVTTG